MAKYLEWAILLISIGVQYDGVLGLEKRSHNHGPEWIDHCWDKAGNHLMDPFCALLTDIDCGAIPEVTHATHSVPENTNPGSTVTYTCDQNYRIFGNNTVVCRAFKDEAGSKNASWTDTPSCVLKTCGPIPEVAHASHTVPAGTQPGDLVTYTCDKNYNLQGKGSIVCETVEGSQMAKWSNAPICIATCGPVPEVAHATHTLPANTEPGAMVTYICEKNYMMNGKGSIECQTVEGVDGSKVTRWTDTPTCIETCGPVTEVAHASHTLPANTAPGAIVTYTCEKKYMMNGKGSIKCQTVERDDGSKVTRWTDTPTCIETCGPVPEVAHATHTVPGSTEPGAVITYTCDKNYSFHGKQSVVCETVVGDNGSKVTKWTELPTCVETCGPVPEVAHATHTVPDNTDPGAVVTYTCDTYYTTDDKKSIVCQTVDGDNGSKVTAWTAPPTCVESKCGPAPSIDNGQPIPYNDTKIGDIVQYVCDTDNVLTTDYNYVTCENDTTWSTPPTCSPVCPTPPSIAHGHYSQLDDSSILPGTEILYTCDKQYEIRGNASVFCGTDGTWSPIPSCECISKPLDILFILDASGSVGPDGFRETLSFVNELVDVYSNAQTRFALISFSDIITLGFNFDTYGNDIKAVKAAVSNISYTTGSTDTAKALQYARENSLTTKNGMRNYASQLAIVVTDGASDDVLNTKNQSTQLKESNVTVYAVGIGVADDKELKQIASSESYVYYVETYSNISQVSGPLAQSICLGGCPAIPYVAHGSAINPLDTELGSNVTYQCDAGYRFESINYAVCNDSSTWSEAPVCVKIPTCGDPPEIQHGTHGTPTTYYIGGTVQYSCDTNAPYRLVGSKTVICEENADGAKWTTAPYCECERNIDVVFIVDGSGSVGLFGFTDTLNFVNDMISRYSAATTRFGLLVFSSQNYVEFQLNEYINDVDAMKDRVANTSYPTGNTQTYDALTYARTEMFQVRNGMRTNASQIAIVVTDGKSADSNKTIEEAEKLRNAGVTIYSIGVGASADYNELISMASYDNFVFQVEDYSNISTVSGPLSETTCIVDCGTPPAIDNGYPVNINDTRLGETVNYMCVDGYVFETNYNDITCEVLGIWTPAPACTSVSCGPPPTIENGSAINENDTMFGDKVNYTCDYGYVFSSNYDVMCLKTGNWSMEPVCRRIDCGEIPVVLHGINSKPNNTFLGSRINYSCQSKYRLVGRETVTCQTDEQWSTVPTCECQAAPLDIVFIADTSGSVGLGGFLTTLDFIIKMTEVYPKATTHFGLVTFSSNATVEFYLNTYINDYNGLLAAIGNATFEAGGTDTYEALQLAGNEVFNFTNGMRSNITEIAVIVTDGQSNNGNLTISEAQNLKDSGVTIYSVGVGDFDTTELKAMASNDNYVFTVGSFNNLTSIAGPLTELTCFGDTS